MINEKPLIHLAVLMTCHNRREITLRCLKALYTQEDLDGVRLEVFLVDDGSTDKTTEAVSKEFPSVKIFHGDGNLFWNRGMHLAFSKALSGDYDYYLWLNDDSILYPRALAILISTHKELAGKGYSNSIIGSAMQDAATLEHTYGGIRKHHSWWGRVTQTKVKPDSHPVGCDASNGNCVLIPREVVEKIGIIDAAFHHRWGDHDYCFRARKSGCTVWLAPGYLGTCSRNPLEGTWEDTRLSFKERIKKIQSYKAMYPGDYLIYLRRHRGPFWLMHFVWPYIKVTLQTIGLLSKRRENIGL